MQNVKGDTGLQPVVAMAAKGSEHSDVYSNDSMSVHHRNASH
jgi:hypothetical protein